MVKLPPLAEQRRIVAKIEALQSRSLKAREAWEAVPPLLEQFCQSVWLPAFRATLPLNGGSSPRLRTRSRSA